MATVKICAHAEWWCASLHYVHTQSGGVYHCIMCTCRAMVCIITLFAYAAVTLYIITLYAHAVMVCIIKICVHAVTMHIITLCAHAK